MERKQACLNPQQSTRTIVSHQILPHNYICVVPYLVEVLALELADECRDALAVALNADGLEDLGDIGLGWGGVTTEGKEKVCCEMLHFECLLQFLVRVAIDRYGRTIGGFTDFL